MISLRRKRQQFAACAVVEVCTSTTKIGRWRASSPMVKAMATSEIVLTIGAAAGVANLELIDKLGLVDNARTNGAYLLKQLREHCAGHAQVAEVRGEGMLAAIEFAECKSPLKLYDPSKKMGPAVAGALAKHKIIARAMPQGGILGFALPQCITKDEIDTVVDGVAKAITEVLG